MQARSPSGERAWFAVLPRPLGGPRRDERPRITINRRTADRQHDDSFEFAVGVVAQPELKSLDESANPELIEHVGWQLAQAYRSWEQRFEQRMARAGYPWVTEAKASVLQHLDRAGTPQGELADKMQLSKQAVQQFVDQLVAAGIVERKPHPEDARGRLIFFTKDGLAFLAQANRAKRDIEREYRRLIGARQFEELSKLLGALNEKANV